MYVLQYETTDKHLSPDGQYVPRIIFVGECVVPEIWLFLIFPPLYDRENKSDLFIVVFQIPQWLFVLTSLAATPTACTPTSPLTWNSVSVSFQSNNRISLPLIIIVTGSEIPSTRHKNTLLLSTEWHFFNSLQQCWTTCSEPRSSWKQSCKVMQLHEVFYPGVDYFLYLDFYDSSSVIML